MPTGRQLYMIMAVAWLARWLAACASSVGGAGDAAASPAAGKGQFSILGP